MRTMQLYYLRDALHGPARPGPDRLWQGVSHMHLVRGRGRATEWKGVRARVPDSSLWSFEPSEETHDEVRANVFLSVCPSALLAPPLPPPPLPPPRLACTSTP